MIKPQCHINAMTAYAVANVKALDGISILSLSQNESLRAPSPRALAAARDALTAIELYPDPEWSELRASLGDLHGIDSRNILCGNGSLDLIGAIAQVYGGAGRSVLSPVHAYPFFRTAALMSGAQFHTAAEGELTVSVDHLLNAVRPETSIVFVANPGNPTGSRLAVSELHRLREGLRPDILLVVDEAYGEFSDDLGERCWDMVEGGNCIVLRTFSKAYGLAGLRVGWGLFPPLVAAQIRKVLSPNALTNVSQAAALAALDDQSYMQETCSITHAIAKKWRAELQSCGFTVPPTHTNFMLIQMENAEEACLLDATLRSQGVILRAQGGARLSEYLRMTIGTDEAMTQAVSLLSAWKGCTTP